MNISKEKGIIALITVLIVGAVSLLFALSTNLLGVGEVQITLKKDKSSEAFYLATACAEEALLRVKNDFSYTLSVPETVAVDTKSCDIISVSAVSPKEIRTQAVVDNKVRRIRILVSQQLIIDSWQLGLVIDSWQEVADF